MLSTAVPKSSSSKRFENLQIIRGLAALLVVFDHTIAAMSVHTGTISAWQYVGYQCGRFGVLVFFVISGFIMVYVSYNSERPITSSWAFVKNRLQRIVPLYWICTVVAICFLLVRNGKLPEFWQMIASFLFLPLSFDFGPAMQPLLGQGWTLYYEIFFYLIFSIGLFFHGYRGIYLTIMIISALVVINIVFSVCDFTSMTPGIIIYYTQPIQILFAVGMVIAVTFKHGQLKNIVIPYAIPISVAIFLLMILQFYIYVDRDELLPSYELLYYIMATAIVFVSVIGLEPKINYISRFFIFLGEASYAIYLAHNFIVGVISKFVFSHANSWTPVWYVPFAIVAAVAFGSIVHILIEKPIASFLRGSRAPKRVEATAS